jgi:hypothetical protein
MSRQRRPVPKDPPRETRFQVFMDDSPLWPVRADRGTDAFTYIVRWPAPDGEIVKVGYASYPARWRSFCGFRGGSLVMAVKAHWRDCLDLEGDTQKALDQLVPRAFSDRSEALDYLHEGAGYLECYRTSPDIVKTTMERLMASALVQN